jgi:putative transposase
MSRYRLNPTPAQEAVLRDHCGHARYTWNLAVERHSHWHPGRTSAPGYLEQSRQLTQAMAPFFDPAGRPSWRKAGRNEGFRIVGRGRQWDVRRVSRHVDEIWVPKAGWVRFRWSRTAPSDAKSYRVTLDRAGRWHVAFAVMPAPVPAPGNGQVVGIDRGVAVSAAMSTGDLLHCPAWAEKTSTGIARRFDVIRVEDLKITTMTRSAKGTRENPGRNVRQNRGSRESQAVFRCTACGFARNADVNAAINVAAGHAVTAREGDGVTRPVNREPHLLLHSG